MAISIDIQYPAGQRGWGGDVRKFKPSSISLIEWQRPLRVSPQWITRHRALGIQRLGRSTTKYLRCAAVRCASLHRNSLAQQLAPEFHKSIPGLPEAAIPEVSVYFTEAWGNRTRIDYGSGMELNFLCWMCVYFPYKSAEQCRLTDSSRICLEKLGVFQESDHTSLVVKVFWRYANSFLYRDCR